MNKEPCWAVVNKCESEFLGALVVRTSQAGIISDETCCVNVWCVAGFHPFDKLRVWFPEMWTGCIHSIDWIFLLPGIISWKTRVDWNSKVCPCKWASSDHARHHRSVLCFGHHANILNILLVAGGSRLSLSLNLQLMTCTMFWPSYGGFPVEISHKTTPRLNISDFLSRIRSGF